MLVWPFETVTLHWIVANASVSESTVKGNKMNTKELKVTLFPVCGLAGSFSNRAKTVPHAGGGA